MTARPSVGARMRQRLAYVLGATTVAVGVAMVPAGAVSMAFREWEDAAGIFAASVITIVAGLLGWRVVGRPGPLTAKEGFAVVGLTWFVISGFAALPYLLTGSIPALTDAVFEAVSGFTTTGASILSSPSTLPRGVLLWRSLTQWLGGMGIIVLSIAILPLLGVGGVQLARAESPGPAPDRLTPRFQETAKRLWLLYALFTLAQVVLLSIGDMDLFQAVNHALTTMSTGGFGTEDRSIADFSHYTQWVIIAFMFIAGSSFALHYRALRRPGEYLRSAEFRLYGLIALGAVLVVAGGLMGPGIPIGDALRDAAFTSLAILTTTGYATADFGAWRPALQIVVFGLMFIGGMAGSTAGSVKIFRVGVLGKAALADLRRIVHPRGVFVTRFGATPVRDPIIESVQSFFLFYLFLFMTGTFLLGFIDANVAEGLDLVTAASAVASSIGNIGPGLGEVGPAGTYAAVPAAGKWLLAFLMIVGRLEVFPVLLLFTRHLWRR